MISKTCLIVVSLVVFAASSLAHPEILPDFTPHKDCHIKYKQFRHHTMCLPKSPNARSVKMTPEWRERILNYHNLRRTWVRPAAANMMKLRWSMELEQMAKRWADACEFRGGLNHDYHRFIPGDMFIGQNLGAFSVNFDVPMKIWWFEKDEYVFGDDFKEQMGRGRCGYMIGHYTQMVWAKSYLIGCAATNCGNDTLNAVVCNYGPSGNKLPFNEPYEAGPTCSKCKNCVDGGLCDCGDLNCHSGEINPENCTCTCTFEADHVVPQFIEPDTCKLNCTRDCKDFTYCGKSYDAFYDCNDHWTVKKCPHMCKVCPYSMEGYDESKDKEHLHKAITSHGHKNLKSYMQRYIKHVFPNGNSPAHNMNKNPHHK